jgi:hypothetical protein
MKRFVSFMLFTTCLLALPPGVRAQDCSRWNNWDLRGTYTMSGSGWVDLSKLVPGLPGVPAVMIPMSWVGVDVWDGRGSGTGWVALNAGGTQFTVQLVGITYAMKADCSIQASFSMKIKELGDLVVGPFSRVYVVSGRPEAEALELHGMLVGVPPGAGPGTGLDLLVSHRISMH